MPDEHEDEGKAPPQKPDPNGVRWFRENSIPIAGVLLIALMLCLLSRYGFVTKDSIEIIKNLVETVAVVIGAGWAYFKFVKGRTFQASLIPLVTGRLIVIDDRVYLAVTIQIKNVGQSKIDFNQSGSALIVYGYNASDENEIHTVADIRLSSFPILEGTDEEEIEPNQIIQKDRLIAVPKPLKLGYRLEAMIVSAGSDYGCWRSTAIVDKTALSDNIDRWLIGS